MKTFYVLAILSFTVGIVCAEFGKSDKTINLIQYE